MNCRGCATALTLPLIDLGTSPPSNAYVRGDQLEQAEQWVPLKVAVCQQCWLVQTEDYTSADSLFDAEYAYFSSFSSTWLAHAERYVAEMVERFGLSADSRVVEVAANDGYLLQYVARRGIPCLGVEPTRSTAQAAREKGLEIREVFFGRDTAALLKSEGWGADLMAANNVLAHVPDINDFLGGFATLLKPTGVATFEFPQLLTLMAGQQFDTLYHEHYSYLSLTAVQTLCERNGLQVFDVSQLSTHGGSLRVFVQRLDGERREVQPAVRQQLQAELAAGVKTPGSTRPWRPPPSASSMTCCASCCRPGPMANAWSATAPPPRAIPCSTTPGSSRTCWPGWPMPIRTSKASTCPAAAFRSCRRRGSTSRSRTTCWYCRGTCWMRSPRPLPAFVHGTVVLSLPFPS